MPLGSPLGRVVSSQRCEGDEMRAIRQAWIEHGIALFRPDRMTGDDRKKIEEIAERHLGRRRAGE